MTGREATDAEMLAAVERWARAREFWNDHNGADVVLIHPWSVRIVDGFAEIYTAKHARPGRTIDGWQRVDPHTALLWAMLVEAGITIDVGPCPACAKRGGPMVWEWAHHKWERYLSQDPPAGWHVDRDDSEDGRRVEVVWWWVYPNGRRRSVYVSARPCPDCNGGGRYIRGAARLVLDAAPRLPVEYERAWRRNPAMHDALAVEADRIQAAGDVLGEWLALWLAGNREGAADAVARLDSQVGGSALRASASVS